MSAKKPAAGDKRAKVIVAKDPAQEAGKLKMIGGSGSDDWNNVLTNQTLNTVWTAHSDDEFQERQRNAAVAALDWHRTERRN